jgi:N utilization substance protein B
MISRRNIRIKVFQTIFEAGMQEDAPDVKKLHSSLDHKFEQSHALFAACCHLNYLFAEYVLIYAQQKASKHLPTSADLSINTKLAGNLVLQKLKNNPSFNKIVKDHHIHLIFENEWIRQLFNQIIDTPEYVQYIADSDRKMEDEIEILNHINRVVLFENEDSCQFMAEKYINWYSDAEMIYQWFPLLWSRPENFSFTKLLSEDKSEFAHELLSAYYDKKEYVFSLIEPNLMNWDADRVAMIDLILLHLGVCEMLYFESIPLKVSINEYIDIAKSYSTPQSGQFVNGLLDNVRKQLSDQNKLTKTDYVKKK